VICQRTVQVRLRGGKPICSICSARRTGLSIGLSVAIGPSHRACPRLYTAGLDHTHRRRCGRVAARGAHTAAADAWAICFTLLCAQTMGEKKIDSRLRDAPLCIILFPKRLLKHRPDPPFAASYAAAAAGDFSDSDIPKSAISSWYRGSNS
jgi:hypothetical protein